MKKERKIKIYEKTNERKKIKIKIYEKGMKIKNKNL